MATTPVDFTVKISALRDIKWALEILDNPGSSEDGKPKKWKFKQAGITRYDLAMNYREVAEQFRIAEKIRMDFVRIQMDEQLKEQPLAKDLIGKWNQQATKDIGEHIENDVVLKLRPIPLDSLDLENNDISFTAIGILIGTVLRDGQT